MGRRFLYKVTKIDTKNTKEVQDCYTPPSRPISLFDATCYTCYTSRCFPPPSRFLSCILPFWIHTAIRAIDALLLLIFATLPGSRSLRHYQKCQTPRKNISSVTTSPPPTTMTVLHPTMINLRNAASPTLV